MVEFSGNAGDFLKIGVSAAERGDVDLVREILKARPKWIHQIGSHGRTMLWEACHRGKLAMVKYLVRRKADIDACGTHFTPYFVDVSCYCIARYRIHDDVADYLLSRGAVLDIHTAAFPGDIDSIKRFLKEDRKLVNAGHPQAVMGGKEPGEPDFKMAPAAWATPLCYALRGGDLETVRLLIKRRAKIKGNEEALFNAADDDVEKIRLLLENGAEPRFAPTAFEDDGELFELLTEYGVKMPADEVNEEFVFLCRGDRGGNPDEVKRLLKLGADINFRDKKGKTALHRAARAGFTTTMLILLDHGASIDIEDNDGETPLLDAVRSTIKNQTSRKESAQILLKAGANPRHASNNSETPESVDVKSNQPLLS